jgi:FtsH-binding integral membrane protein
MEKNSADFRERLLGAQAMTPALREEFRRELDALVYQRMTPRKRVETWAWLIGALLLAAWCVYGLIVHRHQTAPRIVLPTFIVVAAAHVVWLARALRRGGFEWRSNFKLLELWTLAAGVVLAVALLRGIRAPSDPASTFGVLFTFVFYVCCAGMSLQNQIKSIGLANREHLLRIESRLADLAERVRT